MDHIKVQRLIDANDSLTQAGLIRYKAELETLISNIEGTIPGSRGFGLSNNYLDNTPGNLANDLAVELADKCEEYIPEISVDQVSLSEIGTDGTVSIALSISTKEDETDGE